MKKLTYVLAFLFSLGVISACEEQSEVEQKKAQLATYKADLFELKADIKTLESELIELGAIEINTNLALVSTYVLERRPFHHKVDVRGTVKSRNNIILSAEVPAIVTRVSVVEGQSVKRGQLLVTQDAQTLVRSINELESSLELAKTIYERQKKLWESNIGTEVQYLETKNRMESLDLKLATTRSELSKTRIRAPFDGIVDMVGIRTGEMAQPGMPVVRLVSMSQMYITADISESMVGKFKKGQSVEVLFPSTDEEITSKISAIGQVINPQNRTFEIEVRLSDNMQLKPNMIAVLSLTDYNNDAAVTVPTNLIQTDRVGNFLYSLTEKEGNMMDIRTDVELGITYGTETEIVSGLSGNEVIVDKGGHDITDGSLVKIASL